MKQTSAALTFLMAQYRAIFKRAYIKGIASAVLLTAGLAAGQAQAADITWGTANDTTVDVTISGEQTVSGGADIFANDLIITGTGNLTVSGEGTRPVVNNSMTLQSGATLTVNNGGSGIQGSNKIEANNAPAFDTANTTFNATGSTITVKSGSSIQFVNTTIKNSTVTLESGAGIGAEDGTVTLAGDRGVLTLDGGTHTIVGSSYMYGSTVNVTKGTTITMGTASTDNKNSADLYASTNSGKSAGMLNLAGTVNVIASGTALIGGSEVNLTGTINNSGDLILGNVGDGNVINIDGATITNEGKGYIWARADVVMTDGSIVLKDGEGMAGLDPSGDTFAFGSSTGVADFTATGGTIELADADIAMLDVTLGGDVEVTLTGAASGATWKDNSHIDAAVESTTNEGGTFTVKDNASIEMNDGSLLTAQIFNMDGGTITMQGSQTGNEAAASGTAMIRAFPDAIINLNAGEIDITASKAGVIRGEEINLKGTSIDNSGTLTIGGYLNNKSGANTVEAAGAFNMTGGTLSNATDEAILNFGVNATSIDNKNSRFTIAGGTFTNEGTVNVASGSTLALTGTSTAAPTISNTGTISVASGASFDTDGTVTIGSTTDAGLIKFATGASGTFAGENVVLNNKIDIATGTDVKVEGNVTFNGDNSNSDTNKVDLTGAGKLNLNAGSTLTINDAANTLGLTYTVTGDSGSFAKGSGAASISGSDASATLYLDVKNMNGLTGQSFDATELANLKTSLTSALGSGSKYTVNFQGISIDLASGTISSGNSADYSKVEDFLISGVETDELKNTSVAVTDGKEVQGSVGQVTTTGTSVSVADKTLTLNGHATTAGGAVTSPVLTQTGTGDAAKVAGVTLGQGSVVNAQVVGSGVVGAISTTDGKGSVVVGANTDLSVVKTGTAVSDVTTETPSLTYADIGSTGAKVNSVHVAGTVTANEIHTNNLTALGAIEAKGDVVADSAKITGSLTAADVTSSTDFTTEQGAALTVTSLSGSAITLNGTTKAETVSAQTAIFTGGAEGATHTITKSLTVSGDFTVTDKAQLALGGATVTAKSGLTIDGGASLTADKLVASSGDVVVGTDATDSGAGTLSLNTLDLTDSDLVVDPSYKDAFSFVGVGKFDAKKTDYDAGVLTGGVYVLQNSIVSIGEKERAAVAEKFAKYINPVTGGLYEDGAVGAIFYTASNFSVTDGKKIVIDPTVSLNSENATFDFEQHKTSYKGDLNIGNKGVLAVDVTAATKDNGAAALHFDKNGATISVGGDSAKIVLVGEYDSADTIKLFSDSDAGAASGLTLATDSVNQNIRVETLSGLLYKNFDLSKGGVIGSFDIAEMQLDPNVAKSAYTDTSSSVRHSLLAYVAKDTDYLDQGKPAPEHDLDASRIHGARIDGYVWNGTAFTKEDGSALDPNTTDTSDWTYVKVKNPDYDKNVAGSQEYLYLAYEKGYNAFLEELTLNSTSGNAADSAAHMAEFGGVAQVALKAGAATTDAIAGRMGMGAQNSAITFANNGQGAGIWVTPIYVSSDSDGFEAQGVDYGTDINLYGVALGGDYTLANGVRVGAMFNVGSGDADGQGAGSSVTSDFDYYGFGLYAGYSVGQFSIVGDVSYTAVDNDVEANTGIDKLETSLDSSNLSVGVTGSYAFETAAGVTVTPHFGLRYSNIDIDDYSVKGKTYGTVGDYSADSLSVFSIPVGVTIASEFQAGTWSVKPSFDVTLTGNFGDDETEGTFHWAGVENIDSSLNSEIFDNFTYGASLGIAAQSSSGISLGVAVGYTGSSNTDDFGVNANARFTF